MTLDNYSPPTQNNNLNIPLEQNNYFMNGHNMNPIGFGLESNKTDLNLPPQEGYALVINGHSLVHALKKKYEKLFLEIACLCIVSFCLF